MKSAPAASRPTPPSAPARAGGSAKTLGPVSDLERHLPSDWWRHLFNSLYLKTDGDVVENVDATVAEVDEILAATDIVPDSRILDLCCGQGRHSMELARRGFGHVEGVDRSSYLVRLARKRARQENLPIKFREGDVRKYRDRRTAHDVVMVLGNSFGYFDQRSDDHAVLETVGFALRDGGTLVMELTDGEWMRKHHQARSWEWIDQLHFVCRERALSADGERLINREVITHAEKGVIADQFYAERLYSGDEMVALLESAGFLDVTRHGEVVGRSTRDQDLGMMAHRMLFTARAPRRQAPPRRSEAPANRHVVVLLGDPRLPDPVKVGGQFNAEDLSTVARLKEALGELSGYRFEYVDDHGEMLKVLQRGRPELVLNLCDEGYGNDPRKELHVPAVLELLGVPYSGAGPSCLAACYDKSMVRAVAHSLEIPVPFETYHTADETSATVPSVFPVLVKPNFGDSSIGITQGSVVHDSRGLIDYVRKLRHDLGDHPVLIQEFLTGTEYTIGIVGNPGIGYTVLPPLEVDYSGLPAGLPKILGYESKWLPDSPYWSDIVYREARLSEDQYRQLCDSAVTLFERMECRDYARFDFRADAEGVIKLLEVNPNPGWCWDGKFNLMAGMQGLSYSALLGRILDAASERLALRREAAAQA